MVAVRTESLTWRIVRVVSLAGFGIFFLVPLLSMVDFSTRVINGGGRTLTPWANLFRDEMLRTSIISSLLLALLTTLLMLVLLVPTMIWVRLRVPAASKLVEYLCLLPLTIPPLVIVVGIANVYAWVSYLFGNSPLTLTFAYVILVLPYAYRAIDSALASINAVTLAEAARSLGAGWTTVIVRVVLPNIWAGRDLGRVRVGRPGARRVHLRLAAELPDDALRDRPARQERRPDLGGRVAGGAAVRLPPARTALVRGSTYPDVERGLT